MNLQTLFNPVCLAILSQIVWTLWQMIIIMKYYYRIDAMHQQLTNKLHALIHRKTPIIPHGNGRHGV